MILIIKNQTANNISYLSGAVTVVANNNYTATASTLYPLARDPGLVSDITLANVIINDGVTDYSSRNGSDYLNQIALSLGGAVVGYSGANAPSFQITIGGKDSNGKSQPARMNQFSDLSVNYRNTYTRITGNTTKVVKQSSGTLHGIVISDNNTGGTVSIYDNTSATGTPVFIFQIGTASGGLLSQNGIQGPTFIGPLGMEFSTGLTIVTAGSTNNDITAINQ